MKTLTLLLQKQPRYLITIVQLLRHAITAAAVTHEEITYLTSKSSYELGDHEHANMYILKFNLLMQNFDSCIFQKKIRLVPLPLSRTNLNVSKHFSQKLKVSQDKRFKGL